LFVLLLLLLSGCFIIRLRAGGFISKFAIFLLAYVIGVA